MCQSDFTMRALTGLIALCYRTKSEQSRYEHLPARARLPETGRQETQTVNPAVCFERVYIMERMRTGLNKLQVATTPLLFALYPILFLYSRNIQEVSSYSLIKPIVLAVVLTIILGGLLKLLVKDSHKAGLAMVLFWLFFWLYGPLIDFAVKLLPESLGRQLYLFPLWIIIFTALAYWLWQSRRPAKKLLQFGTIVGLVIVGMQIWGITSYRAAAPAGDSYRYLLNAEGQPLPKANRELPNIYHVILDGYPRSDTLEKYFSFNNQAFDSYLESHGFYIASKSHSNYNQTLLSLPSIMNMSYLDDGEQSGLSKDILLDLWQHNKTLDVLKTAGYKYINNSNLERLRNNPAADFNVNCANNSYFLQELVSFSILKPFKLVADETRKSLRKDALCVIDNISGPGKSGPKYIFTHLYPPHPPYIFGVSGEDVSEINLSLDGGTRWLAKEPFIAQLRYVNMRMQEVVSAILNQSKNSIIIFQSDHGSLTSATEAGTLSDARPIVMKERTRNYLALYLPDYCDKSKLYSSMTNVNAFRSVLNSCFGADYPILKDKIFYNSKIHKNFTNLQNVTNLVGD